jgi:hypothetical protein
MRHQVIRHQVIALIALAALIASTAAATAGTLFSSTASKPCFIAGSDGYELTGAKSGPVNHIIRFDNKAAHPSLRMQLVDDPARADFVLVDDGNSADACADASHIETIRLDPVATKPELTISLSHAAAAYKIYVRSSRYTDQDAAALFAVMWYKANATGAIRSADGR